MTPELKDKLRAFFLVGATLHVKRPGAKEYSGVIRELLLFGDGPLVVIDRPRSVKWVRVALPGVYKVGNKTAEVE